MKRSIVAALAAASSLGLTLTGCGSAALPSNSAVPVGSVSAPMASVVADPALKAKLPASIQAAGKIVVGTDSTYKPNEYLDADGKTVIGMDVELFDAVAARMGVTTEYKSSLFDSIIVGITAKKYDAGVSSFTITKDREESVLMVAYMNAGTLWAVAAGNPKKFDRTQLCGLTVAVQTGTVQDDEVKAADAKCAPDKKVTRLSLSDQGEVTNALVTGRAVAMAADSPITGYAIKMSGGKIEAFGGTYDSAPYGFVVDKSQTAFADAIAQALKDIKGTGQYSAILTKYGQEKAAIDTFAVNP